MKNYRRIMSGIMLLSLICPAFSSDTSPSIDSLRNGVGFEQLAKLFEQGRKPSLKEIEGWHSGRSFDQSYPHYAQSALLIAQVEAPGSDQVKIFRHHQPGSPPDFYDHQLPGAILWSIYNQVQRTAALPQYPAAVSLEKSLQYELNLSDGNSIKYAVRKVGKLLIAKSERKTQAGGSQLSFAYFGLKVSPTEKQLDAGYATDQERRQQWLDALTRGGSGTKYGTDRW